MADPKLPAKRTSSKLERLCHERSERDHALARKGHPRGFWYDAKAADFAVAWIEKYGRHYRGEWAGRPLILGEWQRWNFREIFGWKRDDGTRRYRKVWWETPRKNGKTQVAAGAGLFLMVADNEPGAEVYTTATKREQAAEVHEAARRMVMYSEQLREIVKVPKNKLANLTCDVLASKMAILAADFGTLDGLSPHGDIRDEVHQWRDHELAQVLDTATGARRQPLTIEITTAGIYDPEGVGWKHHEYAQQVLDGTLEDDTLFAFISAAEEQDDPWDPATWWKASPNLGVSLKIDYMADQAHKARTQVEAQNGFMMKLLNRWMQQVERWLPMDRYLRAEDPKFNEEQLVGRECVAGLDLSLARDVTALVLVFTNPAGGYDLTCRFWLPEDTIDDEARKGRGFWRTWAEQGWLIAVPGAVIRHSFVRAEINRLRERFNIKALGYDPAEANLLTGELSDQDGLTVVEVRQGKLTLSEPSRMLEASIYQSEVRVTGAPGGPNPIFRYMADNAVVTKNANGDIQPDKARARGKIDGISAGVTALSLIVGEDRGERSMYEDQGIQAV